MCLAAHPARPRLGSRCSLGTKLAVVTVGVLCVVSAALYLSRASPVASASIWFPRRRPRRHGQSSLRRFAQRAARFRRRRGGRGGAQATAEQRRDHRCVGLVGIVIRSRRRASTDGHRRPGPPRANETAVLGDRVEVFRSVIGRQGKPIVEGRGLFRWLPRTPRSTRTVPRILWWALAMDRCHRAHPHSHCPPSDHPAARQGGGGNAAAREGASSARGWISPRATKSEAGAGLQRHGRGHRAIASSASRRRDTEPARSVRSHAPGHLRLRAGRAVDGEVSRQATRSLVTTISRGWTCASSLPWRARARRRRQAFDEWLSLAF